VHPGGYAALDYSGAPRSPPIAGSRQVGVRRKRANGWGLPVSISGKEVCEAPLLPVLAGPPWLFGQGGGSVRDGMWT
jgi:hypothetical protein